MALPFSFPILSFFFYLQGTFLSSFSIKSPNTLRSFLPRIRLIRCDAAFKRSLRNDQLGVSINAWSSVSDMCHVAGSCVSCCFREYLGDFFDFAVSGRENVFWLCLLLNNLILTFGNENVLLSWGSAFVVCLFCSSRFDLDSSSFR